MRGRGGGERDKRRNRKWERALKKYKQLEKDETNEKGWKEGEREKKVKEIIRQGQINRERERERKGGERK